MSAPSSSLDDHTLESESPWLPLSWLLLVWAGRGRGAKLSNFLSEVSTRDGREESCLPLFLTSDDAGTFSAQSCDFIPMSDDK